MEFGILPLIGITAVGALIARQVYIALLSPLAKIPNAHPFAPWTGAWMLWLRYHEAENKTMLAAHLKHGPLIRIGPNELSINCIEEGVKTVYGNKLFKKHHFYLAFQNFGAKPMFATIDPAHHAVKRKRVTNVFSKSYLQSSTDLQAVISEVLHERFLPRLQQSAEKQGGDDVMNILQAVILDCTSGYFWGLENATRYLLDRKSHLEFQEMYLKSRPLSMFFAPIELSTITDFLAKFGVSTLEKDSFYYNDTIDAWCLQMCDGSEETIVMGGTQPGYNPTVYRQLKEATAKENLSTVPNVTTYRTAPPEFRRHLEISTATERDITKPRSAQQIEIASELMDEIVATNEVLAGSLIYTCWELSRHPEVQRRLGDEVRPLFESAGRDLPNPKKLDQLPLLHAVIMESMRRWPRNPGLEPRLTPANTTLAGYHGLPAGIRVSASPWCLHNNPEVFPEPEAWRPERWMPNIEDRGRWAGNGKAERWFFGFSGGLRMCIGNHLSMHLMKFIVAYMHVNFRTSVIEDTGMDVQRGGFMAALDAEELILKVERCN